MEFLINASNLKQGGGVQVADSICRQLARFRRHFFWVVLSSHFEATRKALEMMPNVKCIVYDLKDDWRTVLTGRDAFLDRLVDEYHVKAVLTVFGPSRWRPRVPHLCGFARAQLLLENPLEKKKGCKEWLMYKVWTWAFRRSSDTFYTENAYISEMLPRMLKGAKVYTVSNYYNQVFDHPEQWHEHKLPIFEGTTCLSISSFYPHKNFPILIDAAEVLRHRHPEFKFRFVLTFDEGLMPVPEELKEYFLFIGKVDVSECPDLYRQSDIMVMPTLLECFTATYPEAMRMEVPIVTTDLEFARDLCDDAACYYSATDAEACAEAIYKVATDKDYAYQLVENGKKQLLTYDNYEQRAEKLIGILKEMGGAAQMRLMKNEE